MVCFDGYLLSGTFRGLEVNLNFGVKQLTTIHKWCVEGEGEGVRGRGGRE